jgi:hypothetical protein
MCCQVTCEQQAKIVEEGCKYKLLEEIHPDPREHQAGFLPDISENIQESNKDLAIQMSCEKVLTTK